MSSRDRDRRMRVLVCGAIFGQVYLEAFRAPGLPFELAGILSQGSARSRLCAERYGVPLFTDPEQLPADIDIACVVVRSGLLGGRGTKLAHELMTRGIHVLQEHPLHHDELADSLRQAHRHRVVYHLNSFYVHVAPVRRFIAAARELFRRQRPRFIDAACGFQVAYALLDILSAALGGVRPWALSELPASHKVRRLTDLDVPFRSLDGVLAGVPLTLRVQNQLDPSDPDNHAHLLHRVTFGTEGGSLTLVDTHGPIVWSHRPRFPRTVRSREARPHFASDARHEGGSGEAPGAPDGPPSVTVLGPAGAPSYGHIFESLWPAGVGHALLEVRRAILDGEDPLRRGQYHLTLCQLWQDVTARLGLPELVGSAAPRALTAEDVAMLAKAGEDAGDAPSSP